MYVSVIFNPNAYPTSPYPQKTRYVLSYVASSAMGAGAAGDDTIAQFSKDERLRLIQVRDRF